jgi:hypothetical protein
MLEIVRSHTESIAACLLGVGAIRAWLYFAVEKRRYQKLVAQLEKRDYTVSDATYQLSKSGA